MEKTIHMVVTSVLILACLLFPVNIAMSSEATVKKVALKVEGMSCASCPATVKSALKRLPGVISADVSYKEKKATISYYDGKVTVEKMIKAIEDAGYHADLNTGEKR
ncbi:MAG: heavy metal-associated domain-containing protein [Nitrospirota bacterium]